MPGSWSKPEDVLALDRIRELTRQLRIFCLGGLADGWGRLVARAK
jgi:hypothetical protein